MFSCILEAPDGLSWGEGMAPLVPLKSAYGYVHGVANTGERTQRVTNWTARATIDMPSRKKTQKSTNSRVLNKLPETGILASEDTRILFLFHYTIGQRIAPGAARRYAPCRWQFDPKIAADLRPSADRSAVPTSLVAGGG